MAGIGTVLGALAGAVANAVKNNTSKGGSSGTSSSTSSSRGNAAQGGGSRGTTSGSRVSTSGGSSSSSGGSGGGYTPGYTGTYFADIFADPTNDYNARAYVPGSGWSSIVIKDGKTQTTGLPVGTIVETAGGAYRITGTNPDGSYQSVKYTGSVPETVEDKSVYADMYRDGYNSATIGQMVQDHQNGTYQSGTYAGAGGAYGGSLPSASSQEDYLNDLYDAQQKAALAALEAAYNQNVLDLDAAAAKIPGLYQTARNQTAGDAAIARQNWNEYAAATGLNSGAAGQAQLAMSNQLQSGLSSLSQAEADALAEVESERAKIKRAYQDSVAQAIAQGDLARAEALYQEAVRVDESVVATALQNVQLAMEQAAYQYGIAQDNQAVQQAARARQEENGWVMLNAGLMPTTEQLAAMDLTAEQAAALLRAMA